MGDRLTEEEEEQTSPTPYGDIFDELFPEYLVMGMTPEQYWDGEATWYRAYRKAYQKRIENEKRLTDQSNWYMGQYMIAVLQSVPLLVGGLNVKPSTPLPDYPDKPFLEKAEEQKNEEAKKKHEEDQMKLAMAMFQAGIAKFNKRFEKKQEQTVSTGQ